MTSKLQGAYSNVTLMPIESISSESVNEKEYSLLEVAERCLMRDFCTAMRVKALHFEVTILVGEMRPIAIKVAELISDIKWLPFRKSLLEIQTKLSEYNTWVLNKSLSELPCPLDTPIPEIYEEVLEDLKDCAYVDRLSEKPPIALLQQKVSKLLQDSDWTPFHAKLTLLKLRLDALAKKRTINLLSRIGIINLISNVTRLFPLRSELTFCSFHLARNIADHDINKAANEIIADPSAVFKMDVDAVALREKNSVMERILKQEKVTEYARTLGSTRQDLFSLFIRAGADPNGSYIPSTVDEQPLLIYAFLENLNRKEGTEIIDCLLKAGANPNLPINMSSPKEGGMTSLIFKLIGSLRWGPKGDEMFGRLVDGGMNVNALQVRSIRKIVQENGVWVCDIQSVLVETPLMALLPKVANLPLPQDIVPQPIFQQSDALFLPKEMKTKGTFQPMEMRPQVIEKMAPSFTAIATINFPAKTSSSIAIDQSAPLLFPNPRMPASVALAMVRALIFNNAIVNMETMDGVREEFLKETHRFVRIRTQAINGLTAEIRQHIAPVTSVVYDYWFPFTTMRSHCYELDTSL